MRRALPPALPFALLALLALAPSAAAQDPADAVALVCGLSGDALPVCPREDPAPAQPAAPEAAAPAEAPAPAPEGDAAALADEAQDAAGDVADDPATAPDRIAGLLATLLQTLKDLVSLPVEGVRAAWDGFAGVLSRAAESVASGAQFVGDAMGRAFETVREGLAGLFGRGDGAPVEAAPDAASLPAAAPKAEGLLAQVVDALPAA